MGVGSTVRDAIELHKKMVDRIAPDGGIRLPSTYRN